MTGVQTCALPILLPRDCDRAQGGYKIRPNAGTPANPPATEIGNNAGAMRTISRKGFHWCQTKTMKQKKFLQALDKVRGLKGKERNWFIAGFVDGEGSFNISFAHHPTEGIIFNPKFQVYQHKDHQEILWLIRDVLRCGRIDKKWGTDVRTLSVEGRRTLLEKIIPFFKKYTLVTKRYPFDVFTAVIEMMERGEHHTFDGYVKIVNLVYDMNQHGKSRQISKDEILASAKLKFRQ